MRSRSQGREFILAGHVLVGGIPCTKPGRALDGSESIALTSDTSAHRVGRGYDKLLSFLSVHPVDFDGRRVVDGGAATGGFTQLALELGAAAVAAVELGTEQLAQELASDPRVLNLQGTDLLTLRQLPWACEVLLLDLSGPSLLDILPALRLPFAPEARLVTLVKPRYIVRPVRRRGRVDGETARLAVERCLADNGWAVIAAALVPRGPEQADEESFVLAARSGDA